MRLWTLRQQWLLLSLYLPGDMSKVHPQDDARLRAQLLTLNGTVWDDVLTIVPATPSRYVTAVPWCSTRGLRLPTARSFKIATSCPFQTGRRPHQSVGSARCFPDSKWVAVSRALRQRRALSRSCCPR